MFVSGIFMRKRRTDHQTPLAAWCARWSAHWLRFFWLTPLLLLAPGFASASVVVAEFQGVKKQSIRELVIELLKDDGVDVIAIDEAPEVAPGAGEWAFQDIAKAGGHRAFVMGYTSMAKSGWTTSLTVRDGKTGAVLGKSEISASWYPGLQKALRQNVADRLRGYLERAQAPGGKSESSDFDAPDAARAEPRENDAWSEEGEFRSDDAFWLAGDQILEEEEDFEEVDPQWPALLLDVGGGVLERRWVIHDGLRSPYDGPLLLGHIVTLASGDVRLRFFPAALGGAKVWQHVGLEGSYGRSVAGSTSAFDQQRETLLERYQGALVARIPLGMVSNFALSAGYAVESLRVAGEKQTVALPDAVYRSVRAGGTLEFPIAGPVSAALGGAYRYVLESGRGAGEIQGQAWFPSTRASAAEGFAELSYAIGEHWRLRVSGQMVRYVLDFRVSPDGLGVTEAPPPIAGGAVDRYFGGSLSLGLVF